MPSRMPEPKPAVTYVEDNEGVLYAHGRLLREGGFTVREARSGQEGLHLARTPTLTDVMLVDVRLPDMSGFDVCRQIRADPLTAAIPVVHISSVHAASDWVAQGLEAGADYYLTEPVDRGVLLATLRSAVRGRRAEMEVRAANRRLSEVLDSMTEAYVSLDAQGRVLDVNAAALAYFGSDQASLVGQVFWDAFPQSRGGVMHRLCTEALADGQPRHVEMPSSVQADRWFESHLYPRGDRVEVYALDITARRRAAAEREDLLLREAHARQLAEQANAVKDQFLATLSHELRTPLNAIVGWTQILRTAGADDALRERAVEVIARNAHVQARLIEEILDVSRIVSGKLKLDVQAVDWAQVVEAAVEAARPAAAAKDLALEVSIEPQPGPGVGDPERLQQVAWNLLSNAIKFSARGRVSVHLSGDAETVRLSVRDEGVGIPADLLPVVFERFRQGDASATRSQGGLGLGLAIARQLVELHGGRVSAESEGSGRGSTFTVEVPRRPLHLAGALLPTTPGPLAATPSALGGRHVLIVENDEDGRALLETVLRRGGMRVTVAASAEEARQALTTDFPEAVICDIGMPGESGLSLIRWLRAQNDVPRVPVLALTAYAAEGDRARGLEAGFDAYLTKPFEPSDLLARLASALTR
jgi:PAS domain S-box-containing protein